MVWFFIAGPTMFNGSAGSLDGFGLLPTRTTSISYKQNTIRVFYCLTY